MGTGLRARSLVVDCRLEPCNCRHAILYCDSPLEPNVVRNQHNFCSRRSHGACASRRPDFLITSSSSSGSSLRLPPRFSVRSPFLLGICCRRCAVDGSRSAERVRKHTLWHCACFDGFLSPLASHLIISTHLRWPTLSASFVARPPPFAEFIFHCAHLT